MLKECEVWCSGLGLCIGCGGASGGVRSGQLVSWELASLGEHALRGVMQVGLELSVVKMLCYLWTLAVSVLRGAQGGEGRRFGSDGCELGSRRRESVLAVVLGWGVDGGGWFSGVWVLV